MKTMILSLLTLASLSFGQTPPPTGSLKDTMDAISTAMKTITINLNDSTKNVDSAKQADQLVSLFTIALGLTPDAINKLDTTQKPAAIQSYQSLIQKEIDDAKALESAFQANNNAQAGTILQDMNNLKSQGHSTYR